MPRLPEDADCRGLVSLCITEVDFMAWLLLVCLPLLIWIHGPCHPMSFPCHLSLSSIACKGSHTQVRPGISHATLQSLRLT